MGQLRSFEDDPFFKDTAKQTPFDFGVGLIIKYHAADRGIFIICSSLIILASNSS